MDTPLSIGAELLVQTRRFPGPMRVKLAWHIKGTPCWTAYYRTSWGEWSESECIVHENEILQSF